MRLVTHGRLTSLEGDPELAALSRRHLARLDLADIVQVVCGRFRDTLPDVVREGPLA